MAKKRMTKKDLALLDRLEHLVMRDHGHEWVAVFMGGATRPSYVCEHCGRTRNNYHHGSRTATVALEVACVYSQT